MQKFEGPRDVQTWHKQIQLTKVIKLDYPLIDFGQMYWVW